MPMRGTGSLPMPSSSGGAAGPSATTVPSPGATMRPARSGVTRHGSRTKSAIHTAIARLSQPPGGHSRNRIALATAAAATNFQPSGWIGARLRRSIALAALAAPGGEQRAESQQQGGEGREQRRLAEPGHRVVAVFAQPHPAVAGGGAPRPDAADFRNAAVALPEHAAAGR